MREPRQPEDSAEPAWTPEEIADAKRRLRGPGPFYFSQQVTDRLRALETEWERTGGFDEEYMQTLLERMDEEDPPHYSINAKNC